MRFHQHSKEGESMTENELLKEISFLLRSNLNDKHMSQATLARLTNIDRSNINHYVKGDRMPSLVNMLNICFVLDIQLQDELEIFDLIKM